MKGISRSVYKNGREYYRISVTFRSRHISIGSADDIETASDMHVSAKNALYSAYSMADWSETLFPALSFCKYVSLINFRDSGIYFKTPIYLRKSYFSYYIDPDMELKFDMDDLFYYSGHMIIRRGGHLFVSSYGIQENIAARYGIRSFAVKGRDYRFVNGDDTDYRYSNIEVMSRFQGIKAVQDGHGTAFSARIHVNGDWRLGTFPNEEMAAVAYNKALDELKKRGLKPKSPLLYIDNITAREYADIYSRIELPAKFRAYLSAYDIKHMS